MNFCKDTPNLNTPDIYTGIYMKSFAQNSNAQEFAQNSNAQNSPAYIHACIYTCIHIRAYLISKDNRAQYSYSAKVYINFKPF
jgi:hypothetical protein